MNNSTRLLKSNNSAFMLLSFLCILAIVALLYWNSLLRHEIQEVRYEATRRYMVKVVLHNNSGKEINLASRNLRYYAYPSVEDISKEDESKLIDKDWYQFVLFADKETEWQVEYQFLGEQTKHKYTADISTFDNTRGHRYELHAYLQSDGTIKEERYIADDGRYYKLASQPNY